MRWMSSSEKQWEAAIALIKKRSIIILKIIGNNWPVSAIRLADDHPFAIDLTSHLDLT